MSLISECIDLNFSTKHVRRLITKGVFLIATTTHKGLPGEKRPYQPSEVYYKPLWLTSPQRGERLFRRGYSLPVRENDWQK